MATVDFGQPNGLLFPTSLTNLQGMSAEAAREDAFVPTGLLLQETSITPEDEEMATGRIGEPSGFGGTCRTRH